MRWAAVTLALLALASYLITAGALAVNFPYWDDYYAVLDSLGKVRAADTVADKAAAIFSQHNEHRVAWLRAVVLSGWAVQGRVDFRTLIWLGNLGLVALAATLMAGAGRSLRWPSLLALIPLALLSPIQGKQMIWAMAALSNFWVLVFAALALLLLAHGSRAAFGWACVLAVIATFTSGQGLLCFAAGLALLVAGRRWPQALIWLGITGLCALAYFHHYARPPHHPVPALSWTAVQFFPAMVGSALSDLICGCLGLVLKDPRWQAALEPTIRATVGLALIGLIAWLWLRRYYQRNAFVCAFLLYLLLLCAAASLTRSGFGLEHARVSHYKVISVALLVLVGVGLLDHRYSAPDKPCPQAAALLAGTCFCLLAWCLCYPAVRTHSTRLADGRKWFVEHQDGRGVMVLPPHEQALDILWHSYLTGLLPLADMSGQEIRLAPERLARIATRCAQSLPAPASPPACVVAKLRWAGDELVLSPGSLSAEASIPSGSLVVQGGKLQYVLPAKAAVAAFR